MFVTKSPDLCKRTSCSLQPIILDHLQNCGNAIDINRLFLPLLNNFITKSKFLATLPHGRLFPSMPIEKALKRIRFKALHNKFVTAGSRTWTGTVLPPRDFKSLASAYSAMPANASRRGYQREWMGVDSNHRSNLQQIYSLSPLATREPIQVQTWHPRDWSKCNAHHVWQDEIVA